MRDPFLRTHMMYVLPACGRLTIYGQLSWTLSLHLRVSFGFLFVGLKSPQWIFRYIY